MNNLRESLLVLLSLLAVSAFGKTPPFQETQDMTRISSGEFVRFADKTQGNLCYAAHGTKENGAVKVVCFHKDRATTYKNFGTVVASGYVVRILDSETKVSCYVIQAVTSGAIDLTCVEKEKE